MLNKFCKKLENGALKLCLIGLLFPGYSMAARWASVVVEKAVVFSDVQMSSVIGYIKKGKKVRVGSVPKNKARLLPIVINKKVAYIKIADLNLANDISMLESVTERVIKKMNVVRIKRRLGFSIGMFPVSFKTSSFENVDSDINMMYGFGASGYYFDLEKKTALKIEINSFQASTSDIDFKLYSIPMATRVFAIEKMNSSFDVYAGTILIPYSELNYNNDVILNAQGLGAQLSGEYTRNLSQNLLLHVEGSFDIVKLFNDDVKSSSSLVEGLSDQLNGYLYGPKLTGKITYEY